MWVSRTAAGRAPGPKSDAAAALILPALPAHPTSMSTQDDPERTR